MTWVAAGVAVVGIGMKVGKTVSDNKKRKRATRLLNQTIANRPKYSEENQAMAASQFNGRNQAFQTQDENISRDASTASGQARDVSTNTSDLLSAIANINRGANESRRTLAADEAGFKSNKLGALIDEKDKAWNYNKNMPYQMQVAALRDRIAATNGPKD